MYGGVILIVALLFLGVYYQVIPVTIPGMPVYNPQAPAGCPSGYSMQNGLCVATTSSYTPPASGPFSGSVTVTVTSIDGDTKAALALTNAVFQLWNSAPTMSFEGTCTQATGATHTVAPSNNGQMYLVIKYMTTTVGFVDPAKTIAQNPTFMKSPMFLKDVDTNGQLDQVYPLDFSGLKEAGSTGLALAPISLISWNGDYTVTPTNISSPTGMATAGDYHATGYIAAFTSTYQLQVQIIRLTCNTTAASIGLKFAAGTSTVKSFTLMGVGPQTGTTYGRVWIPSDFANPSYDAAQAQWDIYKASSSTVHDSKGAVDVSQVNYGMPIVNERQTGTTWLMYDIWIHTTADITATNQHYVTLSITNTNPAGTQTTNTLQITLIG